MQVEPTRMYRVKDVAEYFDVSVSTIYRAIEAGHLDAYKLGTGQGALRVSGSALLAYAERCAQAAYAELVIGGKPAAAADTDSGADDERVSR